MDLSPFKNVNKIEEYDDFQEVVIVEDAFTRETIFRNKAYRDLLDNLPEAGPSFDTRFYSIDSFVRAFDGRLAVVEVGFSIKTQKEFTYDGHLRQVISAIEVEMRQEMHGDYLASSNLPRRRGHDAIIDSIVALAMEYYHCPYAQVLRIHEDERKGQYTHYQEGAAPFSRDSEIPSYWDNSRTNFFQHGFSLLCEDMDGFDAFDHDLYTRFMDRGIHCVLMIPFFNEGRHNGFLLLANPRKNDHGVFDLFLGDFAANSIGTMVYRGKLYANIHFDSLTGLPWANAVEGYYPTFVSAHQGIPIAIVNVDFIHFHAFAVSYGTKKGDELLVTIASTLRNRFPDSIVCRQSGTDHFIVITSGLAEAIALEAKTVLAEVRSAYPEAMIDMAFGIYQIPSSGEDFRLITLKAAFAHREGKAKPVDHIFIFDDPTAELEERERILTDRFRKGIDDKEFKVFIQPRYNIFTETLCSGEALVRWEIDGEMVPPIQFIPLFESNGLCHDLDLYMLRETCAFQAECLQENPESVVPLSVNYSRIDFADAALFDKTIAIISEAGIPPQLIEIEITESAYVDFEGPIMAFIAKCHSVGIRILMDDFGSGKSSFSSLKNLDIDDIKLDCKFLETQDSSRKKRKIIESIVALARSLNLPMIVEGVEREDDAAYFRSLGVHYIQGFLFGKPMRAEQFAALAAKKSEDVDVEFADSRLLLDELLDQKSNAYFLFFHSPSAMGIYRYENGALTAINLNQRVTEMVSRVSDFARFASRDLLEFLNPEEKAGLIALLEGMNAFYAYSEPQRISLRHGMTLYALNLSAMLIKTEGKARYFLIHASTDEAISSAEMVAKSVGASYTRDEFIAKVGYGLRRFALIDSSAKVVYYSDAAKEIFPEFEVGLSIADVFGEETPAPGSIRRFYALRGNGVCEIEFNPIILDGEKLYTTAISPIMEDLIHVAIGGKGGYGLFERAIKTTASIAIFFTEIDLEEGYFFQVKVNEQGFKAPIFRQGDYNNDYMPRLLSIVDEQDRKRFAERMSLSALWEGSLSRAPFMLDFGVEEGKRYFRFRVNFLFERGHHYATFFTEDITELREKDFDYLTGLYARNAGKSLMNRYIQEHPLAKMAFIIFDIDRFKRLNDTYGHPFGDKVLSAIHDGLSSLPSEYRFFTRLGGDEFCLLLTEVETPFDEEKTRGVLQNSLIQCARKAGLDQDLNISIGFALIPECGLTINAVYGAADESLYRHKGNKRSIKIE